MFSVFFCGIRAKSFEEKVAKDAAISTRIELEGLARNGNRTVTILRFTVSCNRKFRPETVSDLRKEETKGNFLKELYVNSECGFQQKT